MLESIDIPQPHPYPPRQTAFTAVFWDALAEGRFLATRMGKSGKITFPPRDFDPETWDRDVEWVELSGVGTLYSITSVHAAPDSFAHLTPYQVAIIDLNDGPRLATAFLGPVETPLNSRVELVTLRYKDAVVFAARPYSSPPEGGG